MRLQPSSSCNIFRNIRGDDGDLGCNYQGQKIMMYLDTNKYTNKQTAYELYHVFCKGS